MKKKRITSATRAHTLSLGHETPDVHVWPTLLSTAGVAATIVVTCIASKWIFDVLAKPAHQRSATPLYGEGLVLPPSPRLEGIDMLSGVENNESAAARAQLQSYGWTDRDKRLVHIPIDRAMQLAVELNWLPSSAVAPASDQSKSPPNGSTSSAQKAANQ